MEDSHSFLVLLQAGFLVRLNLVQAVHRFIIATYISIRNVSYAWSAELEGSLGMLFKRSYEGH